MIELLSLIGILDCLHISFYWAFFNRFLKSFGVFRSDYVSCEYY